MLQYFANMHGSNVVHFNESHPNALVFELVCEIEEVFKPAHLALRSTCSGNALLNTIATVFNCLKFQPDV